MTTRVEQRIVEVFRTDIYQTLSIRSISIKLKKSYPHIYNACNSLIHEGVLRKVVIGRSHLCSLNLQSDKSIALLTLIEITAQGRRRLLIARSLVKDISQEFDVVTSFHDGRNLVLVLDHIHDRDAILKMYPEINRYRPVFIDSGKFIDGIERDSSILRDSVVLHSFEGYYRIILRAASKKSITEARA